jgi:hypothetical protein
MHCKKKRHASLKFFEVFARRDRREASAHRAIGRAVCAPSHFLPLARG